MRLFTLLGVLLSTPLVGPSTARAESAAELQRSGREALNHLYQTAPSAKALGEKAVGILVFPEIIKGGFLVAGHYGNGVLFKGQKVAGYYNTVSASYGLQAGVETFGYALFFMGQDDLNYLDSSQGWELGAGPSLTVIDQGLAGTISTTTARQGVFAFVFEQKGLMGGLSLKGSKITRIHPK